MPTNIMSKNWVDYLTLGIAITALILPWLVQLYKKIFDKPVLKCFANKGATLTFDEFGVGLYCTLTVISNKCDNRLLRKLEQVSPGC